ncbi:hypothetical protein QLX08_002095 [Tetragonisca angustula]|uniref:Uncharacterized protein n=1 Tax=Tetragonisca angustula TaxID=166442 RepID=A0AAW1ACY8_9HYME
MRWEIVGIFKPGGTYGQLFDQLLRFAENSQPHRRVSGPTIHLGADPYFFTFHTSHSLWEVRKHGTASPGFEMEKINFPPLETTIGPPLPFHRDPIDENRPLLNDEGQETILPP